MKIKARLLELLFGGGYDYYKTSLIKQHIEKYL
jgi:hypothetical protein